ncbi:MAG: hypothetical protein OES24_04280 [Acidimicrobiia bacterium]|nr:hypothetical protein [Acidimicrobiia bacterium]
MARILIQPEDLARLARRFDAVADELARSGRRLLRSRHEVRLNRADDTFPHARFVTRSALVEENLRRSAVEFRVDAGLMARTVDDAELDDDGDWTAGLLAAVRASTGAAGPAIGSLTSVVTGLVALGAPTPSAADVGDVSTRPIGAGGLFAASSTGGGGQEMLVRLTERLAGSSPWNTDVAAGAAQDVATRAVWARIVGELFAAGDQ